MPMYIDNCEERRRQIVTLLAYPQVGSLSVAAIAINLGTDEEGIQAEVNALLAEGCIVQMPDGRLAAAAEENPERRHGSRGIV